MVSDNSGAEIDIKKLEEYSQFLSSFEKLPALKPCRTFMEISGYPHYENVSSNILGFYFDSLAEHGLRDLLITSFLQMVGKDVESVDDNITIDREYRTQKGRIDLVIKCESFTIGIENKIFHWLANDLMDYSLELDKAREGKNEIIKVVLGLKPTQDSRTLAKLKNSGFVSHTYTQLWHCVRKRLGHYMARADSKWLIYLIDFMETTDILAGENMELKQMDKFFIEHNEVIEKMLVERKEFIGRLTNKIVELEGMMAETNEAKSLFTLPYKYSNDRLVLDFKKTVNNYEISFDFYITPAGWDLQLFGRGNPSLNYLRELAKQAILQEKIGNATLLDNGKRYSVQKWNLETDLDEIRDALCEWIALINEAADQVPA